MSTPSALVDKFRKYCNVLRDDGLPTTVTSSNDVSAVPEDGGRAGEASRRANAKATFSAAAINCEALPGGSGSNGAFVGVEIGESEGSVLLETKEEFGAK